MACVWETRCERAESSTEALSCAGCSSPAASAAGCEPEASALASAVPFSLLAVSVPPISSSSGSASSFCGRGDAGASIGLSDPVCSVFFTGDCDPAFPSQKL